jgi:hypothetical protein
MGRVSCAAPQASTIRGDIPLGERTRSLTASAPHRRIPLAVRKTLLDVLQYVADDFAEFPRLPIVFGCVLALLAYAVMDPVLVGPAFSIGLLGGLAWVSAGDGSSWL